MSELIDVLLGVSKMDLIKEIERLTKEYKLLAQKCDEVLSKECICDPAYKDRKLIAPDCEYCNVGKHILPLALKALEKK